MSTAIPRSWFILGTLIACSPAASERTPSIGEGVTPPSASAPPPVATLPAEADAGTGEKVDCTKSDLCLRYGRCTEEGGECVWGGTECKNPRGADQMAPCRVEGRCTLSKGVCVIRSRADCEQSLACLEDGRCSLEAGSCRLSDAKDCDIACKRAGRCRVAQADEMQQLAPAFEGLDGGAHCIADSDAHCRASDACRQYGMCKHYVVAGRCEAASAADCARSEACKRDGLCTAGYAFGFPDQRCVAKSEALCQKSQACRTDGRCHLVSSRPVVMMPMCAPTSDADCAGSDECKREGFCHYDDTAQACLVRDAEDCKSSEACTREGRCGFFPEPVPRPCVDSE